MALPAKSLRSKTKACRLDTAQVSAESLDDYAWTQPAPDFLKCNVDGAKVEVLRGAMQLLKEKRPGIICEMHSEENRRIVLEEFSRLGYLCNLCGTNHVLAIPR